MKQFFNQAQAEEESEINITPMLDVVFIMLIFFIVTATFVKEAGIDVNRPDAATAVKKENANILIAIGANNDICFMPKTHKGLSSSRLTRNPKQIR
jgi:biopolymer transport protein ExbD